MADQWFAIVNTQGEAVSFGTTVADPLPEGREAVAVDGPPNGRPWDAATKTFGEVVEPEPVDPAARLEGDPDYESMSAAEKGRTRAIVRALAG